MPPIGTKEPRVLCPLCSKEIAAGYMWLHKKQFCPMRPGRQEEIKAEATGLTIVSESDTIVGAKGQGMTPISPLDNKFNNIIPINLEQEYADMVKVMKKKKEEEEEEYQCGGCNATFNSKKQPKHCPECGVELV